MQKNLLDNLFSLTGSINNMAELMFSNKKRDLADLDGAFTLFNGVGSDFGKMVRVIFKFDLNNMPKLLMPAYPTSFTLEAEDIELATSEQESFLQ